MGARSRKKFGAFYETIRQDIFKFAELGFGFNPTWQQAEVFKLVQEGNLRVAVKSGQGPGKTACSFIVAMWKTLQFVDALTVVTAPTMRQVKDVWIGEATRRMEKAHPLLRKLIKVHKTKIVIAGRDTWGVKTVTASKSENAQGFHQDNLNFIVEEASGVEREMIEQIQGTLSNTQSEFTPHATPGMLFMIGNPNTRECTFFDCFNSQREKWGCLTLNAEQSPIVNKENLQRLEEEYGRDSDIYRIRVLGEFPLMDPNCVMSSDDLEACADTDVYECALKTSLVGGKWVGRKQIGIDFARFGSDESVVYRRVGEAILEKQIFAKKEPSEVVDVAFRMQADAGWSDGDVWYVADAGGMGQGVMSRFHSAGKQILEFHTQGIPSKNDYANRMTEAWFELARKVKDRRVHIPKDNNLIQQLSTRQYHTRKKDGALILESKDEYMKRGYDSPDRADAAVMAFYDSVEVESRMIGGAGRGKTVGATVR